MKAYVRPLSITIGVASTLSAALAWTFVACTNPVATAVPLNLFAQSYAQALCGSLDHCCTQNSITFSNDTCTAGWRSLVQAAIDDPTTGYAANYDPNLASTCLSMVRAEAATACVPVDTTQTDARTACEAVFAGKKAPGSPCGASAECAPQAMSTTTCANVAGAVPSAGSTLPLDEPVCVATMATAPMMGDACTPVTSGTDPCDPMAMGMLHCDTTMMSTCQPYVAAESPCAATTECTPGLYCGIDPEAGTTALACTSELGPGNACPQGDECDGTSLCSGGTCVAKSPPGIACTSDSTCASGTCDPMLNVCLTNSIATSVSCAGLGD